MLLLTLQLTILCTPAEEGEGGKIDMIRANVFGDIDIAMMVHPSAFTAAHITSNANDT